jgi:hypothetical protein
LQLLQAQQNEEIGLQKPAEFSKNRWNWAGPNLKTVENIVSKFKKRIKINKIYVKNSNSKVIGEEIFVKHSCLGWYNLNFIKSV